MPKKKVVKKPSEKKEKDLPPGIRYRDGRYTYRYSVDTIENGEVKRKQKETKSYRTAEEAYNAGIIIKASQLQGTYVDEANISFELWVERFLEIYQKSNKKKFSVNTRKSQLKRPLKRFGKAKLKDITAMQYQDFLYYLQDEGLSKNTILGIHSAMSIVFEKAFRPPYELIARDITKDVELPEFTMTVEELEEWEEIPKYLEKEELALFLKTAWEIADNQPNDKDRLVARQLARMLYVLAYTGLRIGELCALEKERIDRINQSLRITKTLYYAEGIERYGLATPKNKKKRDVDVTKKVLQVLAEQELERRQLEGMCESYYSGRNFVFASARRKPGYPVNPRDVEMFMDEVLAAANLPQELTPHSLRHTYTSLMSEAGIELAAIQRQLGHTNDKTTTQIYLHVTKARRRTDVEKFEALMDSVGG